MTLVLPKPNVIIPFGCDKIGMFLNELKDTLVASGLWEVTGSGDGGALVQNQGQTPGENGSFDVFASNPQPFAQGLADGMQVYNARGGERRLTRESAWFQIKEKGSTRTFQFRRPYTYSSDGSTYTDAFAMRIAPGGVKATGATPIAPPLPDGTAWTGWTGDPSAANWYSSSSMFWGYGMRWNQPGDCVMNLLVATDARGAGVCPWALMVVERLRSALLGGMFYESVLDPQPPAEPHPYIFGMSDPNSPWEAAWGRLGRQDLGPFWTNSGAVRCYGGACTPWNFDSTYNPQQGDYNLPGSRYIVPNSEGKWRSFSPRIRIAGAQYVGRSEHFLANLSSRDYPSTFNLASAEPRIALGQLLLPWRQNTPPLLGY